jgi:hypothetical protein
VHGKGEVHESSRSAPVQLHHVRNLLQRGDAEGFATELNLDPRRTRQWFEQGFPHEGYGADVIRALGTLVLGRIVASKRQRRTRTWLTSRQTPRLGHRGG